MKRLISILCLFAAAIATCIGQNRIDELVENFSAAGNSTFTSAVERDSKTRRIVKVVKKLTIEGNPAGELRRAFEAERGTGVFTEKAEDNRRIIMLTTQDDTTVRIYMLRITDEDSYPTSETTIIVRYKQVTRP